MSVSVGVGVGVGAKRIIVVYFDPLRLVSFTSSTDAMNGRKSITFFGVR